MTALSCENLKKVYKQGETDVLALNEVTLEIESGSFVAITGESGSGKSTLLNILACMDVPTEGTVKIGDERVPTDDRALSEIRNSKIGMIFQSFHLLPMLTAEENISLPISFAGGHVEKKDVRELLDKLGLSGRGTHLPSQLSGGQQQRVAIGRALIHKPQILFADEPTGNLDKKNSEEIISLMKTMKEEYHMTLVMVTHSDTIACMAERRIIMEDGRIVGDIKNA